MKGRRPLFKNYLVNQIQIMTDSPDKRISSFCKGMTFSCLPYFHIYAIFFCSPNALKMLKPDQLKYVEKHPLPDEWASITNLNWANYSEYIKAVESYYYLLDSISANSSLKQSYFNHFVRDIGSIDYPISELCRKANVNQGNFSTFLKGELSKLSCEECSRISKILRPVVYNDNPDVKPTFYKPVFNEDGEIVEWITLKEMRRRNIELRTKQESE